MERLLSETVFTEQLIERECKLQHIKSGLIFHAVVKDYGSCGGMIFKPLKNMSFLDVVNFDGEIDGRKEFDGDKFYCLELL